MSAPRPAMTLLPGWGYAASVWAPLRPALEPHWSTLALDLPYSRPAAAWLDPEADWLRAAQPGWFLGWSLGGTLALALAARGHPKVRGVILLASTPCWLPEDAPAYGLDRPALDALAAALSAEGVAPTLRRFNALVSLGARRPQAVQAQLRPHLLQGAAASDLAAGLTCMRELDLRRARAAVPVAGIWGQGDRLLQQGLPAEWLAQHVSWGLSLLGGGHAPAWSEPEAFLSALAESTAAQS